MRSLSVLVVIAAVAAALAVAPAASATTEPNALKVIKVLVSPGKAKFAIRRLERGSIADFRIQNRTKKPVRMHLAGVRSAVVKPGQTTSFFVHLDRRGKVAWSLFAAGKRSARGSLVVY